MHSQEQGLESAQTWTQGWTVGRVSTPLCRQPRTKLNYTWGAGDCQSQDVCTHTVCVCARAQVCMYAYVHVHRYIGGQSGQGGREAGRWEASAVLDSNTVKTRDFLTPSPDG